MYCPLPGWTAVRVSGADATAFLQGQFTNDAAGLGPGATQWNGWCSPKGRLIATFALKQCAGETFILAIPSDVAPAFVKRLRMFVLRSRVSIETLDGYRLIGTTALTSAIEGAGIPVDALDLPDGRRIVVAPAESAALVEEALGESALAATPVVWDQLGIHAGIATITAPTQDLFVPQMLNWELIGGVNFQKGCYPGQEIVARMQYLGRLKERLYRAHVAARHAADRPQPGQPLYGVTFGTQACGKIVNAAPATSDDGYDILAVIQVASAQGDTIRVGVEPGAAGIRIESLPYAVPATKAA